MIHDSKMSAPLDNQNTLKRERPKVGLAVLITSANHPGCILLGKRKGPSAGSKLFATPGGHLEFGESWEECAARETIEETGLRLKNIQFRIVLNAVEVEKNYHYVDIFMIGEVDLAYKEEPENLEPEKCEGWIWFNWNTLPPLEELFVGLRNLKEDNFDLFSDNSIQKECVPNGSV